MENHDKLSDTLCYSCVFNIKLFSKFKTVCKKSDEMARLKLGFKIEEVILEDLNWNDDNSDIDFPKDDMNAENQLIAVNKSSNKKKLSSLIFDDKLYSKDGKNSPVLFLLYLINIL